MGLLNEGFRFRDLETGTFLTRDPIGYGDGPNIYCYVHCNPITQFDAWGLETQSESQGAGEDWYDDVYGEDNEYYDNFDDWWEESEQDWYDQRADQGYNIYSDDLHEQIREGNADARENLLSSSQSTARNETLQQLAYERNWRYDEASRIEQQWMDDGGKGRRPRQCDELKGEASQFHEAFEQYFREGSIREDLYDAIGFKLEVASAVYGGYKIFTKPMKFRRTPKTYHEQLTMGEARGGAGEKVISNLGDPKYKGMEKWHHSRKNLDGETAVIHYVRDPKTETLMDFKYK